MIQGVLWWDEVIAKRNKGSKICQYLLWEIVKIVDERETQKQQQQKKQRQKRTRGAEAMVKGLELNYSVAHLA